MDSGADTPSEEPVSVLADQDYSALKFDGYVTVIEAALREHLLEARGTISFPEENPHPV